MKLLRFIFGLLTVGVVVALLLSYSAMFISPSIVWFTALFGLAYFPLLIVHLVITICWFFTNKKILYIMLLVLLLGWPAHRSSFSILHANDPVPVDSVQTFTIASYNTKGFDLNSEEPQRDEILENIATCGADIICLQEFNTWQNKPGYPENLQEILNRTGITHYYFHKVFENRKKTRSFGLIIFSKFPIIGSGHLEYPAVSDLNTTIWADLVIHGDTVRIYSTHLQSNQLTHSDFEFIHQTADSDTMDFAPKRVAGKFKSSYLLRAVQVEVITSAIQASPYPLIFVGDFNDTPVSYAYRQISSGLSDVFLSCGRGMGATYIPFPFIRIDYMLFTPENFHAVDYTRIKSGGSDHYMIEATFGILP